MHRSFHRLKLMKSAKVVKLVRKNAR